MEGFAQAVIVSSWEAECGIVLSLLICDRNADDGECCESDYLQGRLVLGLWACLLEQLDDLLVAFGGSK